MYLHYQKLACAIVFSTLVVFITGCGFKLRGMMEGPTWLASIAIDIQDVHQDLAIALKENFRALGIPIRSPSNAQCLLIIEKDESQQQITSVSASTTPRQYQLRYTVIYSLLKANGEPMLSSNKVMVTRQLTVNNNRILGSNFEEMLSYKEMRKEAAMQIVNRLGSLKPMAVMPLIRPLKLKPLPTSAIQQKNVRKAQGHHAH